MKRLFFILLTVVAALTALAANEVTPTPIITVEDFDGYLTIYAEGDGTVHLYVDGMEVENPYKCYRTDELQVLTVTATAQAEGCAMSDVAYMTVDVAPLVQTDPPVVTVEDCGTYVKIWAVGDGEVLLYVDDCIVSNPFILYKTQEEQTIVIHATARAENQLESFLVEVTYVVPALLMAPMPELMYETYDEEVVISAVGEGNVRLFMQDGLELPNPYTVPRLEEEYQIIVYATAELYGYSLAQTPYFCIIVPALGYQEPTEHAASPEISFTQGDTGDTVVAIVEFISNEDNGTIYWRYFFDTNNDGSWDMQSDWSMYIFADGPLVFAGEGHYLVEAYTSVDGKLDSETAMYEFVLTKEIPIHDYDFEVGGIYYKVINDDKAKVVAHPEPMGYSGDIVIPSTVSYNNVSYMVTAIDDNAFENCENMTSVSIGKYVTRIGNKAFEGCIAFTDLVLGDYVTTVGDKAFKDCSSLTFVTLGHGMRQLGIKAFAGCPALISVVCKAATPPTIESRDCFDSYEEMTLKVYPAVRDSYLATNYWSLFADIIGEETISPEINDVDADGIFSISDISTLIDRLLGAD